MARPASNAPIAIAEEATIEPASTNSENAVITFAAQLPGDIPSRSMAPASDST
jgi:hypothetical protein